jgi:hypothetical protein
MINSRDAKILESMDRKWKMFKENRNKKIFDKDVNKKTPGWLSMLDRENYIDELMRILKTAKTEIHVYE